MSLLEEFTGNLERVIYYNDESGFLVGRLRCRGGGEVPFVGSFPPLQKEEQLRLAGSWQIHRRYGRQLAVERWERLLPATAEGLRRYLSSGLIKGIGPVTAGNIVDHFGVEALSIIEQEPQRLLEVPGIGAKKADLIAAGLNRQREIQQAMVFLQGYGISPAVILRLYKHYGTETVNKVRENPYRLAEEVYGIGFKTADRIARQLGLPEEAPERIEAAIIYSLDRAAENGHVYFPRKNLISMVEELISGPAESTVQADLIAGLLAQLADSRRIFGVSLDSGEAIYKAGYYYAETGVAGRIRLLQKIRPCWETGQVEAALNAATRDSIRLTPAQRRVLEQALTSGVLVVTGGPGTGKTTIIKALLKLFQHLQQRVLLAAPTGRAAKRVTEATGGEASTIHRLLEYGYQEGAGFCFQRHEKKPLNAGVVIIDEASMVDLHLMHSLLKAIPKGCRLILVGDVDQLPSVGAGSVLRDIIDSGKVPGVQLDNIFRQAGQSMIVVNAHRVNRGWLPLIKSRPTDFFLIKQENPEQVASLIVQLCQERIPNYGPFDPLDDIQVITPMRRTAAGVERLNILLQQALNPAHRQKPEISGQGGASFRLGDKVMQIQNNYQKEVYNGDIGRITSLDLEEGEFTVSYPDLGKPREVVYDLRETDELALSYAVSVHKSQGSEYPVIIMPVLTQHYPLLQRNLLYTGITRARRMVVLVGSWKALAIAVNNDRVLQRYSNLGRRLQQPEPAGEGS